jgi:DNA-binding PadR family transcriptional regulator
LRRSEDGDARGRRAYRLTGEGRKAVRRELGRLENVIRMARHGNLRPAAEGEW